MAAVMKMGALFLKSQEKEKEVEAALARVEVPVWREILRLSSALPDQPLGPYMLPVFRAPLHCLWYAK